MSYYKTKVVQWLLSCTIIKKNTAIVKCSMTVYFCCIWCVYLPFLFPIGSTLNSCNLQRCQIHTFQFLSNSRFRFLPYKQHGSIREISYCILLSSNRSQCRNPVDSKSTNLTLNTSNLVDEGFSIILGSRSYCVYIFTHHHHHTVLLDLVGVLHTFFHCSLFTHLFFFHTLFFCHFFPGIICYLNFFLSFQKILEITLSVLQPFKQIFTKRLQTFCSFSEEIHWKVSGRGVRDCA